MLLVRRKFVVRGIVQGVGYRALVLQVARNMGIKGTVKNLDDGSVEIFTGGTDAALNKFKEKINRVGNPDDFTRIHVETIEETPEDKFQWPTREIKGFQIDYGFELGTPYEKATLEDLEIMKMSGGILREDMTALSDSSRIFADGTVRAFETLFKKYDSFSQDMNGIKDTLKELKDLFGDFSRRYFERSK